MRRVYRSREITNIYMTCNGLSNEEKEQIKGLIRKMARKRKHDNKPRLLYHLKL